MYTYDQPTTSCDMEVDTAPTDEYKVSDNGAIVRPGDRVDESSSSSPIHDHEGSNRDMRRLSIDVNDETCADRWS